jgi:hypothetical protein
MYRLKATTLHAAAARTQHASMLREGECVIGLGLHFVRGARVEMAPENERTRRNLETNV